jgi:MYXO-CTERM domain-containing protein
MGFYIDFAGGIHFFRNLATDNGLAGFMASGSWPDQGVVLANNTIAQSPLGYTLGTRGSLGLETTQLAIVNNVFLHLQRWALSVGQAQILEGDVSMDFDLFHEAGWEPWPGQAPGILAGHVDGSGFRSMPSLEDVQALGLEPEGAVGDPRLAGFDPFPPEGGAQDLRLTAQSALALDTGGPLPASLLGLLDRFGLGDGALGAALDRGAIELDPANPDAPFTLEVGPGPGQSDATPPWDEGFPDPDPDPDQGARDGCGCGAPGGARAAGSLFPLVLAIFALILARRRKRPV